MFTIKSGEEFIADIRRLDPSLKNIRLSSIEIEREKNKIRYNFICDIAVSEELQDKIYKEVDFITLPAFKTVEVSVKKIATNDQLINTEIYRFMSDKYPSVSIFLKPTDILSTVVGNIVKYTLRLTKDGAEYIEKNKALTRLNEHLSKCFCSDFAGSIELKEASENASLLVEEVYASEIQKIQHRTIKVKQPVIIDDLHMGDLALYIEDAKWGDITVCGTVTEIAERQTKNGKPFFIIHLDDTTGKISGVYFSKKATYSKIKDIAVGDAIIARGTIGEYNGKTSFTMDKINRCVFPTDFVKKEKFNKPIPRNYKVIFPEKASTFSVSSVFDSEETLPKELTEPTFVVFDLETTGKEPMNNGITEIGAVKIENGKIVEHFTTLIKPDYKIPEEIVEITGINDEMVKNAPKISEILPDFMKFIDGATLVAQNAEFDMGFLRRFATAEDYKVANKVMDTMILSRELFPTQRHHNLKTIAERFGIVFHHHRALSDAYATAEAFIKMMKIKFNA